MTTGNKRDKRDKRNKKEKVYASPSQTVKRIQKHWRHSSANWIQMIHTDSGVALRLSVGMHRITAWRKKWHFSYEEHVPRNQARKIPLENVIPQIVALGIDGFACYCNNKSLPDCNPLDAAYYVLVIERELHKSTVPWMPVPIISDIVDVKESMDHVSDVVDAMDELRETDPKAAQAHDDSMLERAERRKRQRRILEATKHVEEETPEPIQEQDQEPPTEPPEEEVSSGEEPERTTQTETASANEDEENKRKQALRNEKFSEILRLARHKI